MSNLVKFLIHHAAVGFGLAVIAVGLMVWADIANLGTLASGSDMGIVGLVILTVFMGLTLSSAQMGFAVMLLRDDGDKGGKGGRARWLYRLFAAPAPVAVRAKD